VLVGRDVLLAGLRERLVQTLSAGGSGVLLQAASGLGRSRLLDACALEAKTLGARVLRAIANGPTQTFAVALALTEHLIDALPNAALAEQFPYLFEPSSADAAQSSAGAVPDERDHARPRLRDHAVLRADPAQLQQAIVQLIRTVSRTQALVLTVDDVHRIDEPSAAVLAALMDKTRRGRVFVALTAETGAGESSALDALSRRCELLTLEPLTESETQALFSSVFGDVPHLALVADEIHRIAHGNPRLSIDVAQHLIDRGVITYRAGTWTLPHRLADGDLPKSAEDAIRGRLDRLSPLARFLAEVHALSFKEQLAHEDYQVLALPGCTDRRAVDAAIAELVAQQALIAAGENYVIANRTVRTALEAGLGQSAREERHRALSEFFKSRWNVAWIHHAFAAGSDQEEQALDALLELQRSSTVELELDIGKLTSSYPRAFAVAERLKRPARQVHALRRWLAASSVASGESSHYYWLATPLWLEQLIRDTGLDLWREDAQNPDAGARLTQALTRAVERHQATPEAERVYRVDEAIPMLAEYVAIAIATGVRTMDFPLQRTLPGLLAPFAPLSPVLDALWQNAVCCADCCDCHYERARSRWTEVYAKLENVTGAEVRHVAAIRNAIAFGVGVIEAAFGLASAASWAESLDSDPLQEVSALYLRKIVRLEQGDWYGADKLARQAEVVALRSRVPQMFNSSLTVEISAHALSLDLAGVKHVIERERVEAARHPGWLPYVVDAEGRFELVRGDFEAAKTHFERAIAMTALDADDRSSCLAVWVAAQGGVAETLLGLDRAAEARDVAAAALATCDRLEVGAYSNDLARLLALTEAKLGEFAVASARLERLIEAQIKLGVTGLRLGLSYEARAQIAIWSDDARTFDTYAQLTAREYRHGTHCPLGARYERLVDEARHRGFQPKVALDDFEVTTFAESNFAGGPDIQSVVQLALSSATDVSDRYLRALMLVCRSRAARGGHLYTVVNDNVQLAASCDLQKPAEPLIERVRAFLHEEEERFDTLTVAGDVSPPEDATRAAHTASADGVEYELLLLSCVQNYNTRIAGVIAIAPAAARLQNPREPQLLSTIAAQLVGT
jgi:hypothetical protein